jgi:hypothetical protein
MPTAHGPAVSFDAGFQPAVVAQRSDVA